MAEPKEGVDFEYRTVKGKSGNTLYKNRHFFTAAEKATLSAPKTAPTKSKVPSATKTTKATASTTKVTADGMKGYRKGDVTTAPIASDIAAATRKVLGVTTATAKKAPSMARGTSNSSVGVTSSQSKAVNTGKAESRIPVYTKPTGTKAKEVLNARYKSATKNAKPGMSFTEWKSQFKGKLFAPGEALSLYQEYKNSASYAVGGTVKKQKGGY